MAYYFLILWIMKCHHSNESYYLKITIFSNYLFIVLLFIILATFPSEDLAATNFHDFDDFLKNFNNSCHLLNTL